MYCSGYDKFLEDLKKKYNLSKDRKKIEGKKRTVWYCILVKWKNAANPSQSQLYHCQGKNTLERIFDARKWYYYFHGVYDAINRTFTVTGKFR